MRGGGGGGGGVLGCVELYCLEVKMAKMFEMFEIYLKLKKTRPKFQTYYIRAERVKSYFE